MKVIDAAQSSVTGLFDHLLRVSWGADDGVMFGGDGEVRGRIWFWVVGGVRLTMKC